jgi:hypothetical protein
MNYINIYNKLIIKAKSEARKKAAGIYYEAHHIKPKSFGGEGDCRNTNHPNIVLLTPKEHYIAHLLLTKIYPNSPAMHTALWNMLNTKKNIRYAPSSRTYKLLREEYIASIENIFNPFYGKQHTNEAKNKISLKAKGRQTWLGKKHTIESKNKMRNFRSGTHVSDETKLKIKISVSGAKHYNAKSIKCLKTNTIFGSGKELSEFLNKPFSTVRAYLNGTITTPEWFHYKRL